MSIKFAEGAPFALVHIKSHKHIFDVDRSGEFLSEFFLFYFVILLTIEASLLKSGAFSLEYLPIEYKSSNA